MTQETAYILVKIDGKEFFVSEQQARILSFLAGHNLVKQVLGVDELEFYQVVIDCKGKTLRAKVTAG